MEITFLTLVQAAELLNMTPSNLRSAIKTGKVLAWTNAERKTVLPVRQFGPVEAKAQINKYIAGTLTVIADQGFTVQEQWQWLMEEQPTLAATPIEALENGRVHVVRRLATMAGAM